jgi:hypothetical protein
MSMQFVFWRTTKDLDARKVYDQLMNGKHKIRGLEPLNLAIIDDALLSEFADWTVEKRRTVGNPQTMLAGPGDKGGLDIGYTPQSVTVTCYGMDEDGWNRVIDVMIAQNLPLYDPQINQRFA